MDDATKNTEFEKAVRAELERTYTRGMLTGAQVACNVILDKINKCNSKAGKVSFNDTKRLIADITNFCKTGVSRKINPDGTTSVVEDSTVQN